MNKNRLPMTFRMLHFFSTVQDGTVDHLMEALKSEYGSERQFQRKNLSSYLFSMRENGLIEDSKVELDENEDLRIFYQITDEGSKLLERYLPKDWKNSVGA